MSQPRPFPAKVLPGFDSRCCWSRPQAGFCISRSLYVWFCPIHHKTENGIPGVFHASWQYASLIENIRYLSMATIGTKVPYIYVQTGILNPPRKAPFIGKAHWPRSTVNLRETSSPGIPFSVYSNDLRSDILSERRHTLFQWFTFFGHAHRLFADKENGSTHIYVGELGYYYLASGIYRGSIYFRPFAEFFVAWVL